MTMQPVITEPEQLLFTPGRRLGWTFRDRRQLAAPYPEPRPDPRQIDAEVLGRRARAERAWRFALRWVARPCLPLALVVWALSVFVRDASRHAHTGGLIVTALVLVAAGIGWPAWCYARMMLSADADPARMYQAALHGWRQRAAEHEQAELARLTQVPEWSSASSPAQRTDVYGGTLSGWQALLAVHGASVLAERPLLVADFSGQLASQALTALVQRHDIQNTVHLLPEALDRSGILAGLSPGQLAAALAEAIHAGSSGAAARADRAIDVRVLDQVAGALGASITPARLAAAVQVALGQGDRSGMLTGEETERIRGEVFRDTYRNQIGPSLVRLDAFLADLARGTRAWPHQPAGPAWYTCLALEPGPRSARTELLTALAVQWLTAGVTGSPGPGPAVIVAGTDEITRDHLEALAAACERRVVPLPLLFRHLRNDATAVIGGAAATGFMRLGNHHEADQAAAYIGRNHRFVVSGWTATRGGEHSTTQTSGYSHGTSQNRGFSSTRGWNDDSSSGSSGRSRDYGRSQEWSSSDAATEGTNWSDARNTQRVYEYTVEPSVLQHLPDNALLLPAHDAASVQAVECDPQIITLPGATAELIPPAANGRPEIAPHEQPPTWLDSDQPDLSEWPPQRPDSRWPS